MSTSSGARLPSVSIVMPSYNQGPYIRQAIESVLGQDYPAIEFLVVDGESTDDTLDILVAFGDRLRWTSEPDGGQGEAIDKGIRITTGEIIGWLNSDDLYLPDAVSRAVAVLLEHPEAPAVYGNAEFIDAAGRILGPCSQVGPFSLDRLINELDFVVQPATFFRRSAYLAVGGLDRGLRFSLDYDLWIRLGMRAPLHYLPEVLARVRVHPETKTASGGLARLEEIERMISRHGRRSLPRGFQREMIQHSWRALTGAILGRRWMTVRRAGRRLATYGLLTAGRRVIPRPARPRVGDAVRLIGRLVARPEIPRGRLGQFVREAGPAPPLRRQGPPNSIAIVVPCYRHASYLPAMFESVMVQTRIPDEVIFIDDASDDGTAENLRRLIASASERTTSRLRLLVNDRNLGQAASLNRGIAETASEAIMVLNDDDLLMPDAVEVVCRLFVDHPDVALFGAHSIHFDGASPPANAPQLIASQLGPAGLEIDVRQPSEALRYRRFTDLNMTHSGSAFFKTAWEAVSGYYADKDRRIVPFSDRDFQLRVNALYPVGLSPTTAFSFWRRDSSVDHGRFS